MKIPFIITVIILWIFQVISVLGRLQVIQGFEQIYILSAIVQLLNVFCVGVFFITTGIKMITMSSGIGKNKFRRVQNYVIFLIFCSSWLFWSA
jgi:hypothetical protein